MRNAGLRPLTMVGLAGLVLGLALNVWTIRALYGIEGTMPVAAQVLIWAFDVAVVAFGLLMIAYRRRGRMQGKVMLAFASLAIAFLALELVLRVTGLGADALRGAAVRGTLVARPDGKPGYELQANTEIRGTVCGYDVLLTTNGAGMVGRDVSQDKPRDTKRIAFLGDSFTCGCWASGNDRTFVAVAESELATPSVRLLNFGVTGYGLDDMEVHLKEKVASYQPDVVVVVVFNGNDFRDTYLGLEKYALRDGVAYVNRELFKERVPKEFRGNALEVQPPAERRSALSRLAIYRLIHRLTTADGQGTRSADALPPRLEEATFTSYEFWSRRTYPPLARAAQDETMQTLDRIRRYCAGSQIELRVATLPYRRQVTAPSLRAYEDFDLGLPQRHVEAYCREQGVPYLDLLPGLREGDRTGLYCDDDPHLSEGGHRRVGRLLAAWLRDVIGR